MFPTPDVAGGETPPSLNPASSAKCVRCPPVDGHGVAGRISAEVQHVLAVGCRAPQHVEEALPLLPCVVTERPGAPGCRTVLALPSRLPPGLAQAFGVVRRDRR